MSAASDFLDPHHFYAAFAEGTARYWERRADIWDNVAPRRGDYHGRATREELMTRWHLAKNTATACRNRAQIARRYGATDQDRALVAGVAESLMEAA
jgi:hypothetical protein